MTQRTAYSRSTTILRSSALTTSLVTLILTLTISSVVFGSGLDRSKGEPRTNNPSLIDKPTDLENSNSQFDSIPVFVGLGELFIGQSYLLNHLEPADDHANDDLIASGRISFYLRGKVKGKYIIQSWLDTDQVPLNELGDSLTKRQARTILEKIDPEQYYPVYGDRSLKKSEVQSQGNLFFRLSGDDTIITWGDYRTQMNEGGLTSYSRSLYGFQSELGENRLLPAVEAFWAEASTRRAADELEITGGLMYFLSHDDLVVGSEFLRLETRDADTGWVKRSQELAYGRDYELDWNHGRVLLAKSPESILRTDDPVYLVAEYEYEVEGTGSQAYGAYFEKSLASRLSLGAGYISETLQTGGQAWLYGAKAHYQLDQKMSMSVEWARSDSIVDGRWLSDDGGLTYIVPSVPDSHEGTAQRAELSWKLPFIGVDRIQLAAIYEHVDAGFVSQTTSAATDKQNSKIEITGDLSESVTVAMEQIRKVSGEEDSAVTNRIAVRHQETSTTSITGQFEHKYRRYEGEAGEANTVGVEVRQNSGENMVYVSQQLTVAGSPELRDNRLTMGTEQSLTDQFRVGLEGSIGTQGDRMSAGGTYKVTDAEEVYARLESAASNGGGVAAVLGAKSQLTDEVALYAERKQDWFSSEPKGSNLLGVSFSPAPGWKLTVDYSGADNITVSGGSKDATRDRKVTTFVGKYRDDRTMASVKGQWRTENGDQMLRQRTFGADLNWKYSDEVSFLLDADYTRTSESGSKEERLAKASLGTAYRPVYNDRLNFLGKFTWLETGGLEYSERAGVISMEAVYELAAHWDLGAKTAWKSTRKEIGPRDWVESDTYLWVGRLNYHIRRLWDIYGEYRRLEISQIDANGGVLIGMDKYLGDNTKLGIGYNFTDFDDDLADPDTDAGGWFLSLVRTW